MTPEQEMQATAAIERFQKALKPQYQSGVFIVISAGASGPSHIEMQEFPHDRIPEVIADLLKLVASNLPEANPIEFQKGLPGLIADMRQLVGLGRGPVPNEPPQNPEKIPEPTMLTEYLRHE